MLSEKITGKFTSCVKSGDHSVCKWYCIRPKRTNELFIKNTFICEYCASNYFGSREQNNNVLYILLCGVGPFSCGMTKCDLLIQHGIERRYFDHSGFRFSIKYAHPDEDPEYHIASLRSPQPHIMIAQLPSAVYWDLLITTTSDLCDGSYYIKCNMHNAVCNFVEIPNQYLPIYCNSMYRINSFRLRGLPNFLYTRDNSDDHIFNITIDLYQQVDFSHNHIRKIQIVLKLVSDTCV